MAVAVAVTTGPVGVAMVAITEAITVDSAGTTEAGVTVVAGVTADTNKRSWVA